MQAVLVMFRSDGERRSFSMARDMTVIGRREDCDLRIPLGEVSRKHCRIVRDGDSLKLEDLGSSNGTFLNGSRVQEALLSPGDTIQVGPVVFVLQIDGQPSDDELRPVTMESAAEPGMLDDDTGSLEGEAMESLSEPEEEDAAAHAPTVSAASGRHSNGGADVEELTPVGDNEDAALDALMGDDEANLEDLNIDLDAEEQEHDATQPPGR
jgi:predicted component of type VI protein secretion system